jgi:murein DD-endopeptidase MepM/ murein hydrolase activator NlpD
MVNRAERPGAEVKFKFRVSIRRSFVMKVQKSKAVALFVALGLKNADKWNDQRLAAKLGKIKEMVDEDVKLEAEADDLLKAVMAAGDAGEEFDVEEDAPEAVAPAEQAEGEQAEGEPNVEKAAKPKKEKQPKQPKEKNYGRFNLPMKVKAGNDNHSFAGQVLAEFGLSDEITKEMCDRHCELRGKENDDAAAYIAHAVKVIVAYNAALAAKAAS